MKTTIYLLAIFLLISFSAAAQLYIWTDKDGVKHVTNTAPPPEAQNVQEQGEAEHVPATPTQKLKDKYKEEAIKGIRAAEELQDEIRKRKSEAAAQEAMGDYRISSISVTKEGEDRIRVSGRVSGGRACKTLRVHISLSSDKGGFTNIITSVENAGGSASRIFEGSDWVGSSYAGGTWKIVGTSFKCISN